MNSKKTIIGKLFLLPFFVLWLGMLAVGCSDDNDQAQGECYGYVQFKLYKAASYTQEETAPATRAGIDRLNDAQKIEVEMWYNGMSVIQTLVLNAYNENNAEYGMRSDKLQLLVGDYRLVSYKLYDKLDNIIAEIPVNEDNMFSVLSRGLTIKDLTAETAERGSVTFRLIKDGLSTRAAKGDYLFSSIRIVDVTVTNTFTQQTVEFKKLKVTYKEDSKENVNPTNPDDKYMDIGTAWCDSAVWLPAGTYRVSSYTTYSKYGTVETALETASVRGETFTVTDNKLTKDALIPIQLSETAEHIKDYQALKEIWTKLGGERWSFHGIGLPEGSNWNFNKELDLWGNQPGVTLDGKGRVTGITLEGFGASGRVPDAIGQLTELRILALGTHGELIANRVFTPDNLSANLSDARKQELRMHYKKLFLDRDIREDFSELIQDGINQDSRNRKIVKNGRIQLKDTQIGNLCNNITFVSKAVMRLTNLQQFYIANSPLLAENVCVDWEDPASAYAQAYASEDLRWQNLQGLTDIEVYNCPTLVRLPDFLYSLPGIQALNVACNKGISGGQLTEDWGKLATSVAGNSVQILYLGYNNLEKFPPYEKLRNMSSLSLLDCINNKLTGTLEKFGTTVKLASLKLDNNEIEEIPKEFCNFTDQVEDLSFSHNKLKYIPNIFNANSVYLMESVDLSHNLIGSDGGYNLAPEDRAEGAYKGINASNISLAYNQIKNFPKELFAAGSPISMLNLSGNLMEEVPDYSMRSKTGNYKNTYLLQIIDLRFNKLKKLSDDFLPTTLPYLTNMDVSYNCFSEFPKQPLYSGKLVAFGIRHQRDEQGNRILREWPTGITTCPSLLQLQIGSNDIRKVDEQMSRKLYIVEIKDNPNISIDVSSVCQYIRAGMWLLIYDKTQDIRGCDILDIER